MLQIHRLNIEKGKLVTGKPKSKKFSTTTEISLKEILQDEEDWLQYTISSVPYHSFLNIKSRSHGKPTHFYPSLLQVNSPNYSKIISLEQPKKELKIEEVYITRKKEMFTCPNKHINTGIEHSDIYNGGEVSMINGPKVASNQDNTLLIDKGSIYRTFSEADLHQLEAIESAVSNGETIPDIDPYTILATFPYE